VATIAPGQTLCRAGEPDGTLETGHGSAESPNRAGYIRCSQKSAKRFFWWRARIDGQRELRTAHHMRVAPAFLVPGTETKLKASAEPPSRPSLSDRSWIFPRSASSPSHISARRRASDTTSVRAPFLENRWVAQLTSQRHIKLNSVQVHPITFTSTNINIGQPRWVPNRLPHGSNDGSACARTYPTTL